MCLSCGFYKGRVVIDLAAKAKARSERMQAKRDAIKTNASEATAEPAK
jgi:hypothetical protein